MNIKDKEISRLNKQNKQLNRQLAIQGNRIVDLEIKLQECKRDKKIWKDLAKRLSPKSDGMS